MASNVDGPPWHAERTHYTSDVFVGRAAELDVLGDALVRAQRSGGAIVRIGGGSGVGKSALLEQFAGLLRATVPDAQVLHGRCHGRERLPYGGIDHVLDGLAALLRTTPAYARGLVPAHVRCLSQAFPVFRNLPALEHGPNPGRADLDPHEARQVAFQALRTLLAAIGDKHPLAVLIDDVQWMGPETILLLANLVSGQDAPPMLLALAQRTETGEGPASLAPLLTQTPDLLELPLGPLRPDEGEQLAAHLIQRSGSTADPALVTLRACGHPLLIHELVLRPRSDAPAAVSLDGALSARIATLDPAHRRLLEAIALAQGPLQHDIARTASVRTPDAYYRAVSALRSKSLVTFGAFDQGGTVQVYHDRIRQLVVAKMEADALRARRRALSEAVAEVDRTRER